MNRWFTKGSLVISTFLIWYLLRDPYSAGDYSQQNDCYTVNTVMSVLCYNPSFLHTCLAHVYTVVTVRCATLTKVLAQLHQWSLISCILFELYLLGRGALRDGCFGTCEPIVQLPRDHAVQIYTTSTNACLIT